MKETEEFNMKKTFKSLLSIFLAVFMVASLMAIPSSAAAKQIGRAHVWTPVTK